MKNFIDDDVAERNLSQPSVHQRNDLVLRLPPPRRLLFSLSLSLPLSLVIDLEPHRQSAAEGTSRLWAEVRRTRHVHVMTDQSWCFRKSVNSTVTTHQVTKVTPRPARAKFSRGSSCERKTLARPETCTRTRLKTST